MKYVKVMINNEDIYLEELSDGIWSVLSEAPSYPGAYPITVTVESNGGTITIVGDDDAELGAFLKLLVTGEPRHQLMDYLPPYLQNSTIFKAIMKTEGIELDRLQDSIQVIIDDAYILTATEARIEEWEKALGIIPTGTLAQRKSYIISILRGQGKLNESRIKSIVEAFTGGDAEVTFASSTLTVKVLAPALGDVYLYPDVERSLRAKIPAHITLVVQKYYSTWEGVSTNFGSWTDVAAFADWTALKNYVTS